MLSQNFNELLFSEPYFNSYQLLLHWMSKCEEYIYKTERILGLNYISEVVNSFSRENYAFISRCTHFRIAIKKLEKELFNINLSLEKLSAIYTQCASIFSPFINETENLKEIQLARAGYEVKTILTTPFPLYVSLLANIDDAENTESKPIIEFFLSNDDTFDRSSYHLSTFSGSETLNIKSALGDLNEISRYLLLDVSINVRLFAKITPVLQDAHKKHMSLTLSYLPGVCFFSDGVFADRESLAESIFHETLHMKYLQAMEVYQLHPNTYTGDTGRSFSCSWHPEGTIWKFNRAFGAFHVYAHLYVFYLYLLENGLPANFRQDWVETRVAQCCARSTELRHYVDGESQKAFAPQGVDFYSRICAAVDAV